MVRPNGKQSISAFEKRPIGYEPPPGQEDPNASYWRWRWNVAEVLAEYKTAKSYLDRHSDQFEGLTFVLHPFGQHEKRTRLICLDFDKAIIKGEVDPDVADLVDVLDSFTEFSKSGRGLHVFVLVEDCPAFANNIRKTVGGCKVDVLCSNAVNVTGEVFNGHEELNTISYSELEALPFFEYKEPKGLSHERPEWWSEDALEDVPEHLRDFIPAMESETAVEGEGGSITLFAAACRLMRHGVVGREAEALLRLVPAVPPFSPEHIQRTVECAFNQTDHDGEFNNPVPEFGEIEEPPAPDPEELEEDDREKRYGFNFMSMEELDEADLVLEYLIDGAFVDGGSLFIGGREKTFKTCIAADLLVSLATQTPFLGHFPVLQRRRSVLFTAEIGMARAKTLIKSITDSKGIALGQVKGMDVVDTVPTFTMRTEKDEARIRKLKTYIKERKPEVAVFDPLYFAMGGASVGDMYEIGEILRTVTEICKEHGVWPVFCHHARKDANKEYDPMDLSDFYGSGVGAFARQWMLLSHSAPFRGGVANLYANIGGSSQGARGLFDIKIDEGQSDEITERRWDVTVSHSKDEGGHVSTLAATQAMEGLAPVSPAELAIHMNCKGQEAALEKILHELVRDGRVSMKSRKFELSQGEF